MKIDLVCRKVDLLDLDGHIQLQVTLAGGPFARSAALKIAISHPTDEQRRAFVIGESYAIHLPAMPDKPDEAP